MNINEHLALANLVREMCARKVLGSVAPQVSHHSAPQVSHHLMRESARQISKIKGQRSNIEVVNFPRATSAVGADSELGAEKTGAAARHGARRCPRPIELELAVV